MRNNLKKLIALFLGVILAVSLGATALAAGPEESTEGIDLTAALPADAPGTLKTLLDQIKSKRDQEKALRQEIVAQAQTNLQLEKQIREEIKQLVAAAKDASAAKALKDEIAGLRQQRQDLMKKIADAKKNKDTAALTALQSQLQNLNEKINTDQQAIKDSKAEGTAKAAAEKLAAKLKELKSSVQALRDKMTPFNEDLHANQTAIAAALSSFKTALQDKNYGAAETALQPVIPLLEKNIIDLNGNLGVRHDVTTLLQAFKNSLGAAPLTA